MPRRDFYKAPSLPEWIVVVGIVLIVVLAFVVLR
jgi:Ni/Fe-hydrogenase subunit HybB-like protein